MEKMTRNRLAGAVAWLGINKDDTSIFAATHDRRTAEAWQGDSNAVLELGVIGTLRTRTNMLPTDHVIIEAAEDLPAHTVHQTVRVQATGEEYERVVHITEAYGTDAVIEDELMVDSLAEAMKAKMCVTSRKGRGGWQQCEPKEIRRQLGEALLKGDPVDVANYCMMLFSMGEKIDMEERAADRMELFRERAGLQRAVVGAVFAASIDTDMSAETLGHRSVDGQVERVKIRDRTPEEQAARNEQFMGGKGDEVWD